MTRRDMRIAVVILTRNRAAAVTRALASVYGQSRRADSVVVVDAASSDGTHEAIREGYPGTRLIGLHRNMGCPEGRNIALANGDADVLYSLDDDAWMHEDCLAEVESAFARHPAAGIVASRIIKADHLDKATLASLGARDERKTLRFSGGASAMRQCVLHDAGFYPEDFWRQSEEADLTLRALDCGFEIWYAPSSIVFHPSNLSAAADNVYYAALNSLRTQTRLVPTAFLAGSLAGTVAKFLLVGLRKRALTAVVQAIGVWCLSVPALLRQRRPIRSDTMRAIIRARRADRKP